MENNNKKPIELVFKEDLHQYLLSVGRIDERLPEAPDIETLWAKIGESYLPDAMREFGKYPTVALGWIMFVGMAIAKYWDEDWELYGKVENLYIYLRDRIDFDHMDDYICEKVLLLDENAHKGLSNIVAECAARTYNTLIHQGLEPGTEAAFRGFMKSRQAMMSPTSIAMVRSKMMVRKKVMSRTVTSLLGFFISSRNERHPHIP